MLNYRLYRNERATLARATLARATRVVIHSYLYSGLRPSVRGKITSDNGNSRNLRYTKITGASHRSEKWSGQTN